MTPFVKNLRYRLCVALYVFANQTYHDHQPKNPISLGFELQVKIH